LDVLESTFQKTHYPEIRMVDDLSSMLNLSTERISIWFQNRRARFKKTRKLEVCQENDVSAYATPITPPIEPSKSTLSTNTNKSNNSYMSLGHNHLGYASNSQKLETSQQQGYSLKASTTSFPFNSQHMNQITTNNSSQNIPFPYSNHSK
jgi:hypothetical protein